MYVCDTILDFRAPRCHACLYAHVLRNNCIHASCQGIARGEIHLGPALVGASVNEAASIRTALNEHIVPVWCVATGTLPSLGCW